MFTTYCFSIHTSKRRRASSRHYHSHLTWYSIKSRNLSSAARSRSRRTLPSPVSVLRLAGDGASRSTSTSSCAIARASSLSGGGVDDDDMVEVWWVTTRELSGEQQKKVHGNTPKTRRVACPSAIARHQPATSPRGGSSHAAEKAPSPHAPLTERPVQTLLSNLAHTSQAVIRATIMMKNERENAL